MIDTKTPRAIGQDRRGKHKLNASYITRLPYGFQLDFRLAEPLAWLVAALLRRVHHGL